MGGWSATHPRSVVAERKSCPADFSMAVSLGMSSGLAYRMVICVGVFCDCVVVVIGMVAVGFSCLCWLSGVEETFAHTLQLLWVQPAPEVGDI